MVVSEMETSVTTSPFLSDLCSSWTTTFSSWIVTNPVKRGVAARRVAAWWGGERGAGERRGGLTTWDVVQSRDGRVCDGLRGRHGVRVVCVVIADEGEGSEAEAAAHEARALTSRRSRGPFLSRPLQPREQSRACPRRPSSSPVLSPPSLPPPTLL